MCTCFKGKVHSVGNGFCYEGIIHKDNIKYHFLIDCGSQNAGLVQPAIDDINKNGNLDLFILTHLHIDHYRGLILLLENKCVPKTIILPYMYPNERLFLLLQSQTTEEAEFYKHPYNMIWELIKKYNTRLVLVRGNNVLNSDISRSEESNNEDSPSGGDINWGISHEDENSIKQIEGLTETSIEVIKTDSRGVCVGYSWYFKLYNNEIEPLLIECIQIITRKRSMEELFCKSLDELKKLYGHIANKLGKNINNTSIIVYHAPIQNKIATIRKSWCGTLITGDINLNFGNTVKELLEFYKEEKGKIELFSMPHHGSKYNWNNDILGLGLGENTVCFSSSHSGCSNRMTKGMHKSLKSWGVVVHEVNEHKHTELRQCISATKDNYRHCLCSPMYSILKLI